jgi:hypothetical protein
LSATRATAEYRDGELNVLLMLMSKYDWWRWEVQVIQAFEVVDGYVES